MAQLEDDLLTELDTRESHTFFEIKGKRIEFELSAKAAHRKLKKNIIRWLVTNRP
jgi:hypothetical protein